MSENIERELGSIDARLKNIEDSLNKHGANHDKIWQKVDENRKMINDLYVRVAVISAGVSSLVSGIPFLVRILNLNK